MNFPVTLFRSDFKKNELFISMSQNSSSQLPYSQIQEIRVSQLDSAGNSQRFQSQQSQNIQNEPQIVFSLNNDNTLNQLGTIDMGEPRGNTSYEEDLRILEIMGDTDDGDDDKNIETIQDIDYLVRFLKKYKKLPIDNYRQSLGILLMRMFLEKIFKVYDIQRTYDVEIRPINLTNEEATRLLALVRDLKGKFSNTLVNEYDNLPKLIASNKNVIEMFIPNIDMENENEKNDAIRIVLNIIATQRTTILGRLEHFPNRFFTAIFFTYVLGVNVMPEFTLDIIEDKFKPWNNTQNQVLFNEYDSTQYIVQMERREDRFNTIFEIITILNEQQKVLNNLCMKTAIKMLQAYKKGNTIRKNIETDNIAENSARFVSRIDGLLNHLTTIMEEETNPREKTKIQNAGGDIMEIRKQINKKNESTKPIPNTKQLRLDVNTILTSILSYCERKNLAIALVPNKKQVKMVNGKGKQMRFTVGLKDVDLIEQNQREKEDQERKENQGKMELENLDGSETENK